MANRFEGQTALVTGAASGIGLETARLLADEGISRLVLVDRERIEWAESDDVVCIQGDVADEALWNAFGQRIGRIDLAVLNAGVSGAGPIAELELAEWRRVLAINLDGMFLGLRAALRAMGDGPGSIVVTASATGLKAETGTAAYGASKAGVLQLMRVAAKEAAARRIRVNAIAPAGVRTPMWRDMEFFTQLVEEQGSEEAAFEMLAEGGTPLGRFATANEIARQIAFLLSEDAATITGATLTSDGGYLL